MSSTSIVFDMLHWWLRLFSYLWRPCTIIWVILLIRHYIKLKKNKLKKEQLKKEKEIEYELSLVRPLAITSHKSIDRIISWKYLNEKLFLKLKEKHKNTYDSVLPYEKYLYDDCFLIYDFFQCKNFRSQHNEEYIADCKNSYIQYFKDIDKNEYGLTDKQLEAVFCDEDATLVNAWAGTGKTKTIESKLLHLVDHRGISIDDVLVMTFSKKSQEDMMKRIEGSFKKAKIKYDKDSLNNTVSTFHAFWKRILDEGSLIDIEGDSQKEIGKWGNALSVIWDIESRQVLQKVFDNMKDDSLTVKIILDFIVFHSAPEVSAVTFKTLDEYYKYTKKLYITFIQKWWYNVTVKSYWEYLIANYLWLHNIKVEYEPTWHYFTDDFGNKRGYKPDFYLPDYDIYIEYFWLDKHWNTAPYIAQDEYRRRVEQKISSHKRSWNKLVDIRFADLQEWGKVKFQQKLQHELEVYWVFFKRKSDDEIIHMNVVSGCLQWMGRLLSTFLHLYKESNITISELRTRVLSDFDLLNILRNKIFLKIFELFEKEYNKILEEEGYMDFWDMIYKSGDLISTNKVKRKYKYIMVDEFQDISQARAKLIQEVIAQNKDCRLFCVWDDWQSIYQFSWSDTDIFFNFNKYFGYTKKITLDKTFRFNQWISDLSWWFIMKNPEQEEKNLMSREKTYKWKVCLHQKNPGDASYFFDILDDIIKDCPNQKEIKVFLITRYSSGKYDDWFFEMLKKKYKHKKTKEEQKNSPGDMFEFHYEDQKILVTHTTSHKAKGLESDYVIVDYINQKDKFNFPSSFDDDPILSIITKERNNWFSYAEERRIFYVSMTRGKNKCYMVYTKDKKSIFIDDLYNIDKVQHKRILDITPSADVIIEIDWLPDCPDCGGKLTIRKNSKTGEEFRWCLNYPLCRCTHREKKK